MRWIVWLLFIPLALVADVLRLEDALDKALHSNNAMRLLSYEHEALREAKGWTQADLARKLGITRNGVNSWEQGLSTPSPACLVDLATVFSVSTDYLLGIEHSAIVDVSGLNDKDVAVLAELADRLRNRNH